MKISKKFSLPMQALVFLMFLVQALVFVTLLYLRKDFHVNLSDATGLLGWLILIAAVVLSIWNIIVLINRNRRIKQATDEESKKDIYQSATYGRYFMLIAILLLATILIFLTGNLYYLLFVAISAVWQVGMFPSRNKIANVVGNADDVKKENTEASTPVAESTTESTITESK